MKTRFISAIGGLGILFLVLLFYNSIIPNIALSIIAVICVDEILEASKIIRNRSLSATAFVFAGIIPFYQYFPVSNFFAFSTLVVILLMFCILIAKHTVVKIEQLAFSFLMSGLISISLTLFLMMRDRYSAEVGLFGAMLVFVSAWMSDTGAYFVGVAFGKHKLAPQISPKKTIEGAIGGIVIGLLSVLVGSFIYAAYTKYFFGWNIELNYLQLALISPLLTVVSIIGDLSASVIKRQFGVKDFGKIMPGHGGALDRFDSVLLVCPVVYFIITYCPPIIVR